MIMATIFLSLQQFLLTESGDDLYCKSSITLDEPPVLDSEQLLMVVNVSPEHCALLRRTPLGGAEILSSSVLPGPPWAIQTGAGFLAFE